MFKKIIIGIFSCVVILAVTTFAISGFEKKKRDDLFRQVEIFSDALAIVESEYVDEVKPKDLIYGALKGMIASLDPHSQFMDPDNYNELKVDTQGKFGGLGIEITIKDGLITVVTPIEDTPAWKADIKANDKIVKINDELTRDMTLIDAVHRMRGSPGSPVHLTILRESQKKLLEFKITRDLIKIKDIKETRILEDGIGYIRLVEFRENTAKDFNAALANLSKQGMSALILDLRNNPGGLLETAVAVAQKFIENGKLIVSTKGRKDNQNLKLVSHELYPIINLPMVVLINEGSASGSEIVAGALQDYKRAVIVGIKSFGKGSVQTVIPLSDGSALRLTTSKYFTPLGHEIHRKGVEPDIVVEQLKEEDKIKEEAAKFEKPEEAFNELEKKESPKTVNKLPKEYKNDTQLIRAIDVLKAIKIYKTPVKETAASKDKTDLKKK